MHEVKWKTIRITESTYYKLNDLAGLMSMILGKRLALSIVAEIVINFYHAATYSYLAATVSDPKKLEKARKEMRGELEQLMKLLKEIE